MRADWRLAPVRCVYCRRWFCAAPAEGLATAAPCVAHPGHVAASAAPPVFARSGLAVPGLRPTRDGAFHYWSCCLEPVHAAWGCVRRPRHAAAPAALRALRRRCALAALTGALAHGHTLAAAYWLLDCRGNGGGNGDGGGTGSGYGGGTGGALAVPLAAAATAGHVLGVALLLCHGAPPAVAAAAAALGGVDAVVAAAVARDATLGARLLAVLVGGFWVRPQCRNRAHSLPINPRAAARSIVR